MPRRGARIRCRKTGKSIFRTWDAAASQASRVPGAERPYWCVSCGGYHITSEDGAEYRRRASQGPIDALTWAETDEVAGMDTQARLVDEP